jgi:hypothetical protein
MLKIDPKMLSEIQRKIDTLSRNFAVRDGKVPIKNFTKLFLEKVKENKSQVHIDTLGEALRQYTTTQDLERRFTSLIFLHSFLTQLAASGPVVTCHHFLDVLEREMCPELVNAYTDFNSELTSDLDFDNRKYRHNVSAMSMVLIEKILILCEAKFSRTKDGSVRSWDQCISKLQPSPKALNLTANYTNIDFNFGENDFNYLEEGPRMEQPSAPARLPSLAPTDLKLNTGGFARAGSIQGGGDLKATLAKVQAIRESIRTSMNNIHSFEDIDSLDNQINQYKLACAEMPPKVAASNKGPGDPDVVQSYKESAFSKFLIEETPNIFQQYNGNFDRIIQEFRKGHDKIFGGGVDPQPQPPMTSSQQFGSVNRSTNPFAADLNSSQNLRESHGEGYGSVKPISDFDKFGTEPNDGDPFMRPPTFHPAESAFASNFEDFKSPEVPATQPAFGFDKPGTFKNDNVFDKPATGFDRPGLAPAKTANFGTLFQDEDNPFAKEAKFDDFPDPEDRNRIDQFLKKATNDPPATNPKLFSSEPKGGQPKKQNFADLFGSHADALDQPADGSSKVIHHFDDFDQHASNEDGISPPFNQKSGSFLNKATTFGVPQNAQKYPFVSQVSLIPAANQPQGGKKANFGDLFATDVQDVFPGPANPRPMPTTHSLIGQRNSTSPNLAFKSAAGRDSLAHSNQSVAKINFGGNRVRDDHSRSGMKDSRFSDNRGTLHDAMSRMSVVTSNQSMMRSKQSYIGPTSSIKPVRVDIEPSSALHTSVQNTSVQKRGPSINFAAGLSNLVTSTPVINRPTGFSNLGSNLKQSNMGSSVVKPQGPTISFTPPVVNFNNFQAPFQSDPQPATQYPPPSQQVSTPFLSQEAFPPAPFQSGVKRPAPFAAIYEDEPNVNKMSASPIMTRNRGPSRLDSSIPRESNIIIAPPDPLQRMPSPPTPITPMTGHTPFTPPNNLMNFNEDHRDDQPAFNIDDFGSVKSDENKLVDSIVEDQSNNHSSFQADPMRGLARVTEPKPIPAVNQFAVPRASMPNPVRRPEPNVTVDFITPEHILPESGKHLAIQSDKANDFAPPPMVPVVPVPVAVPVPVPAPGFTAPQYPVQPPKASQPHSRSPSATDPNLLMTDQPRSKRATVPLPSDQKSINSAKQNLPPIPMTFEPDFHTISSDNRNSLNPAVPLPSPVGHQPARQQPMPTASDPRLSDYKDIISKYEQMIGQYRREIAELKAGDPITQQKLDELNATIANLRADNVNLNTKVTQLKIDQENQETKHRNQLLKLKDDFKKNNDAKLVAIERSYNENLTKTRTDYDQQIMALQKDINELTMKSTTLGEEKEQMRVYKQIQFMELKSDLERLRQDANSVQFDLQSAKDKILGQLSDRRLSRGSAGPSALSQANPNSVYNQLLAEKKKNADLTKQVFKLTNDALTANPKDGLVSDGPQIDINKLGIDKLKRQLADARAHNHRTSLAIMAELSRWNHDFGALLRAKVVRNATRIVALENAKKAKENENVSLKFENEVTTNALQVAQTGLKVAQEELQVVKKELIDAKVLNSNNPYAKSELDVDLLKKYKRLEQENKQLVEYNKQIQEELLQTQEKARDREGDSVPLKTHLTLLKRAESERDELEKANQGLMRELRVLTGVVPREGKEPSRKASQASGVKVTRQAVTDYNFDDAGSLNNYGGERTGQGNRSVHNIALSASTPEGLLGAGSDNRLTKGTALLQKTSDIVRDIQAYNKPPPELSFLINAVVSSSNDDLRVTAFNCTQNRYNLVKTPELILTAEEHITFNKGCPEVALELKFRNLGDSTLSFFDARLESESRHVFVESMDETPELRVGRNEAKSLWFSVRYSSNYFLDCRPVWALFQSSAELGPARQGPKTKPLDGFHRFILPLTVNKLLQCPAERLEKYSVLKTLKTFLTFTVPISGSLRYERLAAIFPSVCRLNEDEGLYGVKVASPQGIFFVSFISREAGALTVMVSSMFELRVFEELRETLEFVFRHAFI